MIPIFCHADGVQSCFMLRLTFSNSSKVTLCRIDVVEASFLEKRLRRTSLASITVCRLIAAILPPQVWGNRRFESPSTFKKESREAPGLAPGDRSGREAFCVGDFCCICSLVAGVVSAATGVVGGESEVGDVGVVTKIAGEDFIVGIEKAEIQRSYAILVAPTAWTLSEISGAAGQFTQHFVFSNENNSDNVQRTVE